MGALIQVGLAAFHKSNAKILPCLSEMLDKVVGGEGFRETEVRVESASCGGEERS